MFKNFISALFRGNKGFTLVEMMVVTGIIIIMTAVVFINYRPGSQQLALQRSANKLAQDIRRAQEMAMASAEVGGSMPHGIGIIVAIAVAGPFPLPFPVSTTTYRIYADMNGNKVFDPADQIIDTIDLEKGVFIASIEVPNPPANPHHVILNFSPPDPEVNIIERKGASVHDGTEMYIILGLEADPSKTKIVRVNNAGLIYVE